VAYVLTWRNWSETDRSGPYPGSSDDEKMDFIKFADAPMIHLENEIPLTLYTWP
jgi:hypothetical protein